jgi:hypothetical protein
MGLCSHEGALALEGPPRDPLMRRCLPAVLQHLSRDGTVHGLLLLSKAKFRWGACLRVMVDIWFVVLVEATLREGL